VITARAVSTLWGTSKRPGSGSASGSVGTSNATDLWTLRARAYAVSRPRGVATATCWVPRNRHALGHGLVAEIVDFQRFHRPRDLMAYLGLVPSEYSSGEGPAPRLITKTGSTHPRRVLVEACWHYRHRPALGHVVRQRAEGQPRIATQAWRAQQRLHRRYRHLVGHGKRPPGECLRPSTVRRMTHPVLESAKTFRTSDRVGNPNRRRQIGLKITRPSEECDR
jgi:Transposase IS116/IS110/IS902 family